MIYNNTLVSYHWTSNDSIQTKDSCHFLTSHIHLIKRQATGANFFFFSFDLTRPVIELSTFHTWSPPCAVTFSWWGDCVPQWPS